MQQYFLSLCQKRLLVLKNRFFASVGVLFIEFDYSERLICWEFCGNFFNKDLRIDCIFLSQFFRDRFSYHLDLAKWDVLKL